MAIKKHDMIAEGLELASTTCENGGWSEYFQSDEPKLNKQLNIKDQRLRALTAIMLENERLFIDSMDEATRLARVGGFIDYLSDEDLVYISDYLSENLHDDFAAYKY